MNRKDVVRKFIGVGSSTLASRFLGIARDLLQIRYLGAHALSDAFNVAIMVPNYFRKIFAEGAVSASLVPPCVHAIKKGNKQSVNSLILLSFIIFEGIVLTICALCMWQAELVISFLSPGFNAQQIANTAYMLRIVMPFLFFLSGSAIFASALQAQSHFFIPAISPAVMNIVYISSILLCMYQDLPISYFCYPFLVAGFIQLVLHIIAYLKLKFAFTKITHETWQMFKPIGINVLLSSITMASELFIIIDYTFASYLPAGSISLLNYSKRFMGIPLGLFASTLSTILLPYFSRVSADEPKRLNFYLLEASKLVFWVIVPLVMIMSFFSGKIFSTLYLSQNFSYDHVLQAQSILIAFLLGSFFLSLNKILLNVYYARHVMWLPALISVTGALINILSNFLLRSSLQATGLALGTSIAACIQTILLLIFLNMWLGYNFYFAHFIAFMKQYFKQLAVIIPISLVVYYGCEFTIACYMPKAFTYFFLHSLGYWFWVGPLCLLLAVTIYFTRRKFGVKLYFID